jgi:hypothetical protein
LERVPILLVRSSFNFFSVQYLGFETPSIIVAGRLPSKLGSTPTALMFY